MDNDLLKYYKVIGELHNLVLKADNLDAAMKAGAQIIAREFGSSAVIIWSVEEQILKPCYWIGAMDITSCTHDISDDVIGKVYSTQDQFVQIHYDNSIPEVNRDFKDNKISSLICVPFASKTETYGCVEIVRFVDEEPFTEEMADVCGIMSMMFAMSLENNESVDFKVSHSAFNKVILSARNVNKSFQSGDGWSHILKGVDLDVYEGEFLVILGESGCGKSTFLNIIGGMDTADSGSIKFMDQELFGLSVKELTNYRRYNIGFVFQSYNLMPNLTAKQNLDLIAELVDDPMDSVEILNMVGLEEKINRYPSRLSGGQQQRISIARALVKRPKIIFADEPTAALDYMTSVEVLSVFEKVVEMGTTLVMVTHNEEITKMADRVVRFRNGKTYEVTVNRKKLHATDLIW